MGYWGYSAPSLSGLAYAKPDKTLMNKKKALINFNAFFGYYCLSCNLKTNNSRSNLLIVFMLADNTLYISAPLV